MAIILGKYLGNFHLILRWQILRVAQLAGVRWREAETWRAVIKNQIRALIPFFPTCQITAVELFDHYAGSAAKNVRTEGYFFMFPLTSDILLARGANYLKNIHWQPLHCSPCFFYALLLISSKASSKHATFCSFLRGLQTRVFGNGTDNETWR